MRVCSVWYAASVDPSLWKTLLSRDCLPESDFASLSANANGYEQYRSYASERRAVLRTVLENGVKANTSLASLCYYGRLGQLAEYFADPNINNIGEITEYLYYRDAWVYYGNFHSSSEHGYIALQRGAAGTYFYLDALLDNGLREYGEDETDLDVDDEPAATDVDAATTMQVNQITRWKGTALHYACLRGNLDCAIYLLKLAPEALDMKMEGSEYRAIDIAKLNHHSQLVAYLRKLEVRRGENA
jgi:hypothetical protein